MPVSTNDLLNTKNVRVENPDGSKAVFMYFDPTSDALALSHVNPDINAIPTFENFNFDLSTKPEFYAAESMTSIYIYFDSNKSLMFTVFSCKVIFFCKLTIISNEDFNFFIPLYRILD